MPGKSMSIQVCGSGSISANNEPLYVIDGFAVEPNAQSNTGGYSNGNPMDNLNPNDIESMQVLKDASAAAMYGSRGANGVVIITTKKGKTGKPQVSVNSYWGFSQTQKKLDVLSSEEWVDRYVEMANYKYIKDYALYGADVSDDNDRRRAVLATAGHPVGDGHTMLPLCRMKDGLKTVIPV